MFQPPSYMWSEPVWFVRRLCGQDSNKSPPSNLKMTNWFDHLLSFLFLLSHGFISTSANSLSHSHHQVMALVNPILSFTHPSSLPPRLSILPPSNQSSPPLLLWSFSLSSSQTLFNPLLASRRNQHSRCRAIADIKAAPSLGEEDRNVLVGPSSEEERREDRIVTDYDWTEEWYPLYLTQNLPDDAPLGLKVFDKQLVLFKDGNGELRCYEDRCPHR